MWEHGSVHPSTRRGKSLRALPGVAQPQSFLSCGFFIEDIPNYTDSTRQFYQHKKKTVYSTLLKKHTTPLDLWRTTRSLVCAQTRSFQTSKSNAPTKERAKDELGKNQEMMGKRGVGSKWAGSWLNDRAGGTVVKSDRQRCISITRGAVKNQRWWSSWDVNILRAGSIRFVAESRSDFWPLHQVDGPPVGLPLFPLK
jgi:hypothetical protein